MRNARLVDELMVALGSCARRSIFTALVGLMAAACGDDASVRTGGSVGTDSGDALTFDTGADAPTDVPSCPSGVCANDVWSTPEDATTGPLRGEFLWPCENNSDCSSDHCVTINLQTGASACTKVCVDDCPDGWACKTTSVGGDLAALCLPQLDRLCQPCVTDTDCGLGNLCVALEGGRCARSCESRACPEDYLCADVGTEEQPNLQCLPAHGSCDCPKTVDFQYDPSNCGSCGKRCEYDFAVPDCALGECNMGPCFDDHVDLDGQPENGCEYECKAELVAVDYPDVAGKDADCDGIDGDAEFAVFVSPDGTDLGNSLGTRDLPFKTIKKAIEFTKAQPGKLMILISKGTYLGQLVVEPGINLFGGYDRAAG